MDTGSTVEDLVLCYNNIDDEGAAMLVKFLAQSSSVSTLTLQENTNISVDGWIALIDVLKASSASKLKTLKLGLPNQDPEINEKIATAVGKALAHNSSLETLDLFREDEFMMDSLKWWDVFCEAICNNSSIADICSSNHTLHKISHGKESLFDLWAINRMENKSDVVRVKILKYFMYDDAKVGPTFADFSMTMMPAVIGWIGRDGLGYSVMYELLRCTPSLLACNIKL
jgi:hypothetical protein